MLRIHGQRQLRSGGFRSRSRGRAVGWAHCLALVWAVGLSRTAASGLGAAAGATPLLSAEGSDPIATFNEPHLSASRPAASWAAAETVVFLEGTVVDSVSGAAVAQASVQLEQADRVAALTDARGEFRFQARPGPARVRVRHTAYEPATVAVVLPAPKDTLVLVLRLRPRVFQLQEYVVNVERVVPLSGGEKSRYALPRDVARLLGLDGPAEFVTRLPGAVLLGDRPFFRGAGSEHLLPLLDGVPAREPLRGEWVMPPPDAILVGELVPGGFDAEHGQALAGVLALDLPEGGAQHRARLGIEGDRLLRAGQRSQATDIAEATLSGPVPGTGLNYVVSGQARLSDTHLHYDHARPEQRVLGFSVGKRMSGQQTGLVRLAWKDEALGRRVALMFLQAQTRAKSYHDHYSRTGWVGYQPEYDRYTTYVDPAATPDSVVFYDAPPHVPTRFRSSRLAQATLTWGGTKPASLRATLRAAEHRYLHRVEGLAFTTDEEGREWIRHATTRTNHQEELFYATHGDYPEYEDGRSRELAGAAHVRIRGGNHELAAGGGLTLGRHRFFLARPDVNWTQFGSLARWIRSRDLFGYVQDTWWSDVHSSMTVAVRWDAQHLGGYLGDGHGDTFSPRLAFRQPFGTRDAFHTQVGLLYQFPPLIEHFQNASSPNESLHLRAQRVAAFEVGLQHHFSSRVVGYAAGYVREYEDLVFTAREASDEDALFPGAETPAPVPSLKSRGIELLLDHQFHRLLTGQLQVEFGQQLRDGIEVPWGRRLAAAAWWIARPVRATQVALAWRWDSGQRYSVCLRSRGCEDRNVRYEGRLPSRHEVDLTASWRPPRTGHLRLTAEVRNLLGQRVPTFGFGTHGSRVGVGNFLAYYDRYGRAGGYLIESAGQVWAHHISNPQTRGAGRNLRLGLELEL